MIGGSFKQKCPSCEAMVLVKSPTLIGKKIECPKCKDRFIIAKPATPKKVAEPEGDDDDNEQQEQPVAPVRPKVKPRLPSAKSQMDKIVKEFDQQEATARKKGVRRGAAAEEDSEGADESADEGDEEGGKKPKKKAKGLDFGSKKTRLGLGLAIVGVIVLGAGAYFILGGPASTSSKPIVQAPPPPVKPPPPDNKEKDKKPPTKTVVDGSGEEKILLPAGPELTNLLPPDTEQVMRIGFKAVFDPTVGLLHEVSFGTEFGPKLWGPFTDDAFKKKLSFSVLKIDEFIQAERFTAPAWSFNVVHVMENLDINRLSKTLGLEKVKEPIKNQFYYKVTGNPWLEQLGRMAPGVPAHQRAFLARRDGKPLYVFPHTHQTLILADEAPMRAFLEAEGQFKFFHDKTEPPKKPIDPKSVEPIQGVWMTIRPELKNMLERLLKDHENFGLIYMTATDVPSSRVISKLPRNKGLIYRPRAAWDITTMLEEQQRPRLSHVGSILTRKGPGQFFYRTDLIGNQENDAREVHRELTDITLPRLAQIAEQFTDTKINKGIDGSRVICLQLDKTVRINMDILIEPVTQARVVEAILPIMIDSRGELALFEHTDLRQQLAFAARQLSLKGLPERSIAPGRFPVANFPRPGKDRPSRDPALRVGWMSALLPYLGHDKIYNRIQFDGSWQDQQNWTPGMTLIPQFLDPTFPDRLRYVQHPYVPVDYAATHFVGIAGVGLDAAEYAPSNPKRGILGYDYSASVEEVQKGRGLSNTILMIQTPPDAPAGVAPWMAGGGSTLRGVPEQNSIAPFVLSKENDPKGLAKTYAVMADGSVRIITRNVSDAAFQAMCTYQGANPPGFDWKDTTLESPPRMEKKAPDPKEKDPPKKK